MENRDKYSFAEDVGQRGAQVYHMLHLYDDDDCVNLYHGDGAVPPHPIVQNALNDLADNIQLWNKTNKIGCDGIELRRYRVPNLMTIPTLREAILNDFSKYMPLDFDPSKVTVHTACGVTHLAAALFNHFRKTNAEVIMFAPTYTSFLFAASTVGCNVHLIQPTSDGMITPEHIEQSLDEYPQVKYIFLINPNNPTGQYYSRDELEQIARLVLKRDLIVISDEIFHKLVFDENKPYVSMASIEVDGKSMLERTVTLRGISKDHGLAAIRAGYAIGLSELMNQLSINWFTFGTTFNLGDLAQYVAMAVLSYTPDEYYQDQQNLLRRHRDLILASIDDINQNVGHEVLSATGTTAGIFQLIDASSLRDRRYRDRILNKDTIVCQVLLEEEDGRIALFPASCGGFDAKDMKLRLTLSSSEDDIKLGMKRLSDFILKLFQQN